jgi:hypothetical protein
MAMHDQLDGQQVAMRQGNDLYYTVNDPSGTTQMVMDETGELVGRAVFDAFGGVLENTVPMTLTQAFPNTPDAATGLLHLGNGRWYDPAWGRPLQPNAAGGPPTVPQALNRFAATPLGQPGVYSAAASSQWYAAAELFGCCQLLDIGVDLGAYFTGKALQIEKRLLIRTALLKSRTVGSYIPPKAAENVRVLISGKERWDGVRFVWKNEFVGVDHGDKRIAGELAERFQKHLGLGSLDFSPPGSWHRVMGKGFNPLLGGKSFSGADLLAGGGIGFVFDASWQFVQDWGNPYLTPDQKAGRAIVAGGVGFVAGLGVVAFVGTGPVGFAGALFVGWFVEAPISEHVIFPFLGLIPTRNLAPLSYP